MTFKRLVVKLHGPVAYVILNRPEVRNAMDEIALGETTKAFRELGKNKKIRAVVLSGAGKDFCAGADIGWMRRAADYGPAQNKKDAHRLIDMCRAVDEAPFAVVTKVHGNCFGGALGIVGSSDLVIAETSSRFRFSEVRLGLIPAVVSTFVLPKIGVSQARRLYLTAELFTATTAKEIGLVHYVVPKEGLDDKVREMLDQILWNGPEAVRAAKTYIRDLEGLPRAKRIQHSMDVLAKVRGGNEAKEGLSAFLEKREPKWAKA